jgi:DNA-binding HxlR family transcriptional regulator
MLYRTYDNQACSVARTLELVGERWTLLIIRDALTGVHRFDGFLTSLGIARNVLTSRLNSLVDYGIMQRVPYQERPVRYEYRLTPMGAELTTAVISLMDWGDRHLADAAGSPRTAEHESCGGHVTAQLVCDRCATTVSHQDVELRWNQDFQAAVH